MNADLLPWLREQIAETRERAEAAGGATDAGIWEQGRACSCDAVVGCTKGEGCPLRGSVVDADGSVVVYDEGAPSVEEAAHIAAAGPRTVLAQCEAHTAILDEHSGVEVASLDRDTRGQTFTVCRRCRVGERQVVHPCPTRRAVGLAYQHRPGYREEWRP